MTETSVQPTVTLAYWKIRGLAQPIRYLLAYAGVAFENRVYEISDAPEFDRSCWFDVKYSLGLDFPNLPYLIDGAVKLTQTNAILRYVARKHGIGGETLEQQAREDMAGDAVMDLRNRFVRLCYGREFDSNREWYLGNLPGWLLPFETFLKDNGVAWLGGDKVCFADFHLYEMLRQHQELMPSCLDQFPRLLALCEEFEKLPAIQAYRASDAYEEFPLNNKTASFGNSLRVHDK